MKVIILAGGTGTRLRPVSTQENAKQFLKLDGERTLLETTIQRVEGLVARDDIYVSTTQMYARRIEHICDELWLWGVIVEPSKRNTAWAIACIVHRFRSHQKAALDESLVFLPADHLIRPIDRFHRALRLADAEATRWSIVVFGVTPTRPETWYGYIQTTDLTDPQTTNDDQTTHPSHRSLLPVQKFHEKPNISLAKEYLADGNYYWNSGMFVFSLKTIYEEFVAHAPEIAQRFELEFDEFIATYETIPDMPFDVAIMEHTQKAQVVPMTLQWNDIWSRDSIYEVSEKDDAWNVLRWEVTVLDVRNSLIWNETDRPVKVNNLENMIYVVSDAGVYMCSRGSSQEIKNVL